MELWLHEVNEAALFFGLLLLLIGAAELGFRIAGQSPSKAHDGFGEVAAIQGAVLGLLALLLGFTFSLAMERFETRKELIRDEANAIGTTYLRAQLLPEPMQSRIPPLLRSYVEVRLELTGISYLPERLREAHLRSGVLHRRLWAEAVAAARSKAVDGEMISLFVSALNDTIDMHGKRMAAIRNRVPAWIFVLLFLIAAVALGLTGYGSGPNHRQSFVLNSLVALLIAAVTILILDLHRPARGLISVDQTSLVEVRESMGGKAR